MDKDYQIFKKIIEILSIQYVSNQNKKDVQEYVCTILIKKPYLFEMVDQNNFKSIAMYASEKGFENICQMAFNKRNKVFASQVDWSGRNVLDYCVENKQVDLYLFGLKQLPNDQFDEKFEKMLLAFNEPIFDKISQKIENGKENDLNILKSIIYDNKVLKNKSYSSVIYSHILNIKNMVEKQNRDKSRCVLNQNKTLEYLKNILKDLEKLKYENILKDIKNIEK